MWKNALKYGEKDIAGCGLIGFINRDGTRVGGAKIKQGITNMRDRGNGLGSGFAGYGIYPEYADCFALHLMCDGESALEKSADIIGRYFLIRDHGEIPTRQNPNITTPPVLYRFFVRANPDLMENGSQEEDVTVQAVMDINENVDGTYVFSSGRNMGVFKGVGEPDDMADFYRIDEYEAYTWIAHTRFPTNTPGWWGGAHPFTILDRSIVHNGELSSYGINKRYLESYGYKCMLLTDTEVVAYLIDNLMRNHGLPLKTAFLALTPPFWKDIDHSLWGKVGVSEGKGDMFELSDKQSEVLKVLRTVYSPAMLNGPFAIIFGITGGIAGLNDRIKLRPFVAGEKDETIYMSSEEAAIREVSPDANLFFPRAGEPVIAFLNESANKELLKLEEDAERKTKERPSSLLGGGNNLGLSSRALTEANGVSQVTSKDTGALGVVIRNSRQPKIVEIGDGEYEIDTQGVHYRLLNTEVRELARNGTKRLILRNVSGQRYIGTGIKQTGVRIEAYGTPGNDLATFMDGPEVEVYGNAQDGVGNTMNSGTVAIHGSAGDVLGYGMRGGQLYIYGDVGYRVGIHMKAFEESIPRIVVGGTAGDFFGEYMAGGILIILGMTGRPGVPILGDYVGTGMHGGLIFVRGEVDPFRFGKEIGVGEISDEDRALLKAEITNFSRYFNMNPNEILDAPFIKLYPKSHRPYGQLYGYWWLSVHSQEHTNHST